MKKLCFMFVIFLVAFSVFSCGTKEISGNVNDQSQPQSGAAVSQEDVKITITPPTGWEPVADSVLPVQYMKNTASFMVKSERFNRTTVDEVVDEAKTAFESIFDDVEYIGNPESIIVDGYDARKLIFTCKVSSLEMKYEYVYLFAGGKVFAITFGDLSDTFDSLSDDYDQILKDIKFE